MKAQTLGEVLLHLTPLLEFDTNPTDRTLAVLFITILNNLHRPLNEVLEELKSEKEDDFNSNMTIISVEMYKNLKTWHNTLSHTKG